MLWRFDAGLMLSMARLSEEGDNLLFIIRWPVVLSPRTAGAVLLVDSSELLRRFPEENWAGALRHGAGLPLLFYPTFRTKQKCALGRIQIVTASRAQCDGMTDVEGIRSGFFFQASRALELPVSP